MIFFDEENLDFMVEVTEEYLTEYDCAELQNDESSCKSCSHLKDCYYVAMQQCDSQFAESIDYSGYDTEEEFWENLLD